MLGVLQFLLVVLRFVSSKFGGLLCFHETFIQGNQAFKDKQWQRAIGFYTEAIKFNPNNATYYSNRAAAYLELGRYCLLKECLEFHLYLFLFL